MEKKYTAQIKQFGLNVRRLRESTAISQQEVADRCEVDIRTIQRIEKGDYGVGLHILLALSAAFEVKPSELLKSIETD